MKKYSLVILLFIVLSFIIGFNVFTINKIDEKYKDEMIKNNAYIISSIIEAHPELESEIIANILANKDNEIGYDTLTKYGLDDTLYFSYYSEVDNLKNEMNVKIIVSIIVTFLSISIVFLLYIAARRREIKRISKVVNRILKGDYAAINWTSKEGETGLLSNDISKIIVLLKEERDISTKDKKELEVVLSDISHQLKTPLTSMYVINDLLNSDKLTKKERKEFLNKNKTQLERIEWLVSSLLKISMLDSGTITLKKKSIKLNELVNSALEPLKIPVELKEQKLLVNVSNDKVNCDVNWTREALINIIKNAYEHTDIKGTIKIESNDNPIYTELTIEDSGEGIDKDIIPHIFERFYKASPNKESVGIGLNMAKTVFDKQGIDITVKSEKGKYTKFSIKFYKNM